MSSDLLPIASMIQDRIDCGQLKEAYALWNDCHEVTRNMDEEYINLLEIYHNSK